jgi:arginine/lysine/histidine transport system ATP-binding protein
MINVKQLSKSFGDNEVLKAIDLTVKEGEVVVIIGPSGSGKSTILRCLNLLEEPTSGEIFFEGKISQHPTATSIKFAKKWAWFFKASICSRI